jgi:hypothetical protein
MTNYRLPITPLALGDFQQWKYQLVVRYASLTAPYDGYIV